MKKFGILFVVALFVTGCAYQGDVHTDSLGKCERGDTAFCLETYVRNRDTNDKGEVTLTDSGRLARYWYKEQTGRDIEPQVLAIVTKEEKVSGTETKQSPK